MAKIMYLHHNAYLGGGSLVAANTAKMLSSEHDVTLYIPNVGGENFIEYVDDLGIKYKRVDFPFPSFSYYSGSSSLFSLNTIIKTIYTQRFKNKWKETIKKENPDIVLVNSSTLCPMGEVIRAAGAKSICLMWETFRSKGFNLGTKYTLSKLKNFDAITFTSNYDKEYSALENSHRSVFINPIRKGFTKNKQVSKAEASKTLNVNPNKFKVLYLGGFGKIKGPDLMLKAIRELADTPNIQLIFAGQLTSLNLAKGIKGKLRALLGLNMLIYNQKIKRLITDLGEQISIVGLHSDVSILYSVADLVVCPSQSPHHLLPIHEAGLYELPVITTDFEQIKDHAVDRHNCLLFSPDNDVELAGKIKEIYLDTDLRNMLSKNNYVRAQKNFDYDYIKANINKVIDSVLNKK